MSLIDPSEASLHEREIAKFIQQYEGKIDAQQIRSVYEKVQTHYLDATTQKFIFILVSKDVTNALKRISSQTNTAS